MGQVNLQYFEGASLEDAWRELIHPWACDINTPPLSSNAIIAPNTTTANAIKQLFIEAEINTLGIHFLTPSVLRKKLLKHLQLQTKIALREDLHLLLSVIAADFSPNPTAQAIAAEPEAYLQAFDTITAAGWDQSAFDNPILQQITHSLISKLKQHNLQTVQQVDRLLPNFCKTSTPLFNNILIWGFTSKHWNLSPLILAATHSGTNPILCFLAEPGVTEYEQAWQGTWESYAGSVQRLPDINTEKPFATLAENFAFPDLLPIHADSDQQPLVLYTQTANNEALAITRQILKYLQDPNSSRIGVVFSNQSSSVAREVSASLAKFNIPHFDSIGHFAPKPQPCILFEAWVSYQQEAKLDNFIHFLNLLLEQGLIDSQTLLTTKKDCTHAFRDLLTDDTNIIFARLENKSDPHTQAIIQEWPLLPESFDFNSFTTAIRPVIEKLQWPKEIEWLEERFLVHSTNLNKNLPTTLLLDWLVSVTSESGRIRYPEGSHPFAKVQIVTAEEAQSQQWTHLILGELCENIWPAPTPHNPFLNDSTIEKLNNHITQTGNQGLGQVSIKNNFALLTSSISRHTTAKNIFQQLLALPTQSIALSAHTQNAMDHQYCSPSEFLEIVYWLSEGEILCEEIIDSLIKNTELHRHLDCSNNLATHDDACATMLSAYQERHTPDTPFGKYSFSLEKIPLHGITLSCKAWEDAIQAPAYTFFKHILGVEKLQHFSMNSVSAMAVGTWAHNWMEHHEKPTSASANAKAFAFKNEIIALYKSRNRDLPSWWNSYWQQAQKITSDLVNNLILSNDTHQWHSEYSLPKSSCVVINEVIHLSLSGRIDLLVSEHSLHHTDNKLWIIDYKTGPKGSLSKRKLAKSHGLQLALYALSFYQKGFSNISLSILDPNNPLKEQLTIDDVLDSQQLLKTIQNIAATGRFGQRGPVASSYQLSHEHFPIATLPLSPETITSKWQLTHPAIPF